MPNLNITFQGEPLPSNFNGSLQDYYAYFLANIWATIDSNFILEGQIGGGAPTLDAGPWLNGQTWYVWNGTEYVPVTMKIGGGTFQITLAGTPTANRTITFQDRAGTVALLSDVHTPRPTVILTGSGAYVGVDWRLSSTFYHKLTGNTVYALTGTIPGQEICMAVVNDETAYTVSWQPYVIFPGLTNPTQTTAGAGQVRTDLYIIKNIGGTHYARQIPNYY